MARCKDKAVETLNNLGYDVVRFPRSDIAPLDVIVLSEGSHKRLAPLPNLWVSNTPLPAKTERPAPNVKTVESSELKGKFGIGAIVDIFSKLSLSAAAKRAKSVQFVALEPTITSCVHADIEEYVNKGQVNTALAAARHFFDDNERVYIITEVIASKKLKIIVGGDSAAEAAASAAEITGSISASGSVGSAKSAANEITYEQDTAAVFGFASAEILYEDGWLVNLPRKPGSAFLGKGGNKPPILSESVRLVLTETET